MNTNTPETARLEKALESQIDLAALVNKLERERDESRKLLRDANRGAERNAHISQSLASQLVEARRERDEARAQHAADVDELNQRLIDRHADMMATIVELRNKLTELQRQLT